MSDFTKGEWRVVRGVMGERGERLIIRDDDGFICEIPQRPGGLALLHLIVSLPLMYEALKGIVADLENIVQPSILEATYVALAKLEANDDV